MLDYQRIRWRSPSRPYWIALLLFFLLGILFMVNDWRAIAENQKNRPATRSAVSP